MFSFIVIDPRRPVVPPSTLGIEVTIPEVAALCDLGNIDPQHSAPNCTRCGSPSRAHERGDLECTACGWDFPRDMRAAIEVALTCALPSDGATMATIRPDLDAFGAMAVIALRRENDRRALGLTAAWFGEPALDDAALARVAAIAAADGNTRTTWEPRALPTAANPWPAGASIDSVRELAAVAAVVSDRGLDVASRVAVVAAWLLGREEPSGETAVLVSSAVFGRAEFDLNVAPRRLMRDARARVEHERADMIAALEDGRIEIRGICVNSPFAEGSLAGEAGHDRMWCPRGDVETPTIAVVRSAHRAATSLGQSVAPLAICFHPAFAWPSGEKTPKVTIAWAVPPGSKVVARVRDALNHAEGKVRWHEKFARAAKDGTALVPGDEKFPEWGGNLASGILGSPQGCASLLSEEEIVATVRGAS